MSDELTRQGIAALKAGDKSQARSLFMQALQNDPNHQVALLWLATVLDDPEQKRQCLERIVAIDPNSDAGLRATAGLDQLKTAVPSTSSETVVLSPAERQQVEESSTTAKTVVFGADTPASTDDVPTATPGASDDVPTMSPIPDPLGTSPTTDPAYAPTQIGGFSNTDDESTLTPTPISGDRTEIATEKTTLASSPTDISTEETTIAPAPAEAATQIGSSGFGLPSSPPPADSSSSPASAAGAFGVPSMPSSTPAPAAESPGFGAPGGLYEEPKKRSNTWLIVGIVAAVILIPTILCVGAIGFLTILGDQVSETFGEIASELEEGGGGDFDSGIPSVDVTGGGNIEVGDTVESEIESFFDGDDWTFEGEAGQQVTIRADAAPGSDTDPRITLIGPDGSVVDQNDDTSGSLNAALEDVTLPADGTYTIRIDVFETGPYELSLE